MIDLGVETASSYCSYKRCPVSSIKDDYEAHEARICIAEGGLLDDARRV